MIKYILFVCFSLSALAVPTNPMFDMISPMTTIGDTIFATTSGASTRLGIGSTGQVLGVSGGVPAWGSVAASALPLPGVASLGGSFSKAVVSHNFLTGISSVDGSVSQAQPAFTDISGSIAVGQIPNLTNDSVQVLTGFSASAGTVASTDTTLGAINKIVGNINAFPSAPVVSTVSTTDATVTTIYTFATASDTSYIVTQDLIARRTGGSAGATDDSMADHAIWMVKNVGGTASVAAISQQLVEDQGPNAWTLTAAASTTNVLFKVKGLANNNVNWNLSSTSISQ